MDGTSVIEVNVGSGVKLEKDGNGASHCWLMHMILW